MDPNAQPDAQSAQPPPGVVVGPPVAAPPPGVVVGPPVGGGAPAGNPPPGVDLTANPNSEGTYKLDPVKGGASIMVPYSKMESAFNAGYGVSGPDMERYQKDRAADPNTSALKDLRTVLWTQPVEGIRNALRGADKATAEIPLTIGKWLGHKDATQAFLEKIDPGVTAPISPEEQRGANIEGVGEFALGDAEMKMLGEKLLPLLKGANYAEKVKALAPVMKFATDHPAFGRVLANATRQGSTASILAVLHGADVPEALKQGAAVGGASAALEGIPEGFNAAKESFAAKTAARAAFEQAPKVLADRTAAMAAERQATAQGGVKDVAKDATRNALTRVSDARPLAITGEPVGETAIPPIDADKAAESTNTFGDSAEQVRNAVKPVFQKLDEISGGKFKKAQTLINSGYSTGDFTKVAKGEQAIDTMLKSRPDEMTPEDYTAAKSAWSDSKVLDRLHSAVEGSFNGISEEMAAQPGTGERLLRSGNSEGGSLQKRIGSLVRNPEDKAAVERVIGKDGLTNLYRASNLVSTPELKAATTQLADDVARQFPKPAEPSDTRKWAERTAGAAAGAAVAHATGIPYYIAAPIGGVMPDATKYVMQRMLMSPRIGQLMDYAVRSKVASKVAAPLIANEIRREEQESGGSQ